jgi:hypothetical protein
VGTGYTTNNLNFCALVYRTCGSTPLIHCSAAAAACWATGCDKLPASSTCNATCNTALGFVGTGYTTTFQADRAWSKPFGNSSKPYNFVCYNECKVGNCDSRNGCTCGLDKAGKEEVCTCSATQGLREAKYE